MSEYYDPGDARGGGAVGINGRYTSSGVANIGGSLWVGSNQGISSGGDITVANELRTNGDITSSQTIDVQRDAYVAGDILVQQFQVGGTLFTPADTQVAAEGQIDVVRQDVGQIEPCNCDDPIDIAGLVELNQDHNHNDDIGLDPGVLSSFNDDVTIDIECGRFYLDAIEGAGNVTINVTGRTAIFIGGDVSTAGLLTFNVGPNGVVDAFVAGDMSMAGGYVIGDPDRPASARFYSGGDRVSFSEGGVIAGNVYAPEATMTFSAPLEVYGSLFARRVEFSDSLTVHYDEAILTAGEECEETGGGSGGDGADGDPCTSDDDCVGTCGEDDTCVDSGGGGGDDPLMCLDCEDCGNQACNDGECGECSNDLDCCSPLICYQGECILVIP